MKAHAGIWSDAVKRIADEGEDLALQPVRPARVEAARSEWIERKCLPEFYVDFETTNDGQFIFMVGCGHVEEDAWQYRCFIAEQLTEEEEARVLDEWFDHMAVVRDRSGARHRPEGVPLVAPRAVGAEKGFFAAQEDQLALHEAQGRSGHTRTGSISINAS